MEYNKAYLLGDRKWTVDATGGITSLTRRYMILRSAVGGTSEQIIEQEITSCEGLPQLMSAHSETHDLLLVDGYSFEEGSRNDKAVLFVDVHYSVSQNSYTSSLANFPLRGADVEQWGWRNGTVMRDLIKNVSNGELILNSAKQPFDSVPQIEVFSPTFTKVFKTTAIQNWLTLAGKINRSQITIGELECAPHTLRVVQLDCERLWRDEDGYNFRWTIGLQYQSNKTKIGDTSEGEEVEIGWDYALIDNGTMQLKREIGDGETSRTVEPIKVLNRETGNMVVVTNPVLLDGFGHYDEEQTVPFVFRIQAYEEADIPTEFYSAPALPNSITNNNDSP